MNTIIYVTDQINIVISETYDFIDLTFDRVHDRMQLCHAAAK